MSVCFSSDLLRTALEQKCVKEFPALGPPTFRSLSHACTALALKFDRARYEAEPTCRDVMPFECAAGYQLGLDNLDIRICRHPEAGPPGSEGSLWLAEVLRWIASPIDKPA